MKRMSVGLILVASAAMAASPRPARAPKAMVSSASELASRVGVDILKQGGNAVDAAVAVAFALAVTYPTAGNIGGGGFMIVRMNDGRAAAIDYRETAPAKAHKAIFLDAKGDVIPGASKTGHKSVGVPGTVAGMALALETYGSMKWRAVVEPARRLAVDGFAVSHDMARSMGGLKAKAKDFAETNRVFGSAAENAVFRQPDLATTLGRIAAEGPREFYEGRTAQLLAKEMSANGGLIGLGDLKNYKAIAREPIRGAYRGYELMSMPPTSSGGLLLMQMLAMLERHDIAAMGPDSSAKYHLLVETMKRCYADRAAYVGDPGFVKVPVLELLSKSYVDKRAASIDLARATPSSEIHEGLGAPKESADTTHFSIRGRRRQRGLEHLHPARRLWQRHHGGWSRIFAEQRDGRVRGEGWRAERLRISGGRSKYDSARQASGVIADANHSHEEREGGVRGGLSWRHDDSEHRAASGYQPHRPRHEYPGSRRRAADSSSMVA